MSAHLVSWIHTCRYRCINFLWLNCYGQCSTIIWTLLVISSAQLVNSYVYILLYWNTFPSLLVSNRVQLSTSNLHENSECSINERVLQHFPGTFNNMFQASLSECLYFTTNQVCKSPWHEKIWNSMTSSPRMFSLINISSSSVLITAWDA